MIVQIRCKKCLEIKEVKVQEADYEKFMRGEGLIQNIFPYLSPGERELFQTQICDTCFKAMFK